MNRGPEVNLMQRWEELPVVRRHLYFYVLLILATILASNLRDEGKKQSMEPVSTNPPAIQAKEVYPAPVSL